MPNHSIARFAARNKRPHGAVKDYHGHQFVDGQGESFRAVACFAPYPKVCNLQQLDVSENEAQCKMCNQARLVSFI